MPCESLGDDTCEKETRAQLILTTQMLCELCGVVEAAGYVNWLSHPIRTWWEAHKIQDALRQQREAQKAELQRLRHEGLRMLTAAQRQALTLPDPPADG